MSASANNPRPVIARTLNSWRLPPGFVVALVQDVENALWVVESCPAGTRFWSVEQARHLASGTRTGAAFRSAVNAAEKLAMRAEVPIVAPVEIPVAPRDVEAAPRRMQRRRTPMPAAAPRRAALVA